MQYGWQAHHELARIAFAGLHAIFTAHVEGKQVISGIPDQPWADGTVCTPSFKPSALMTFITVANSGLPSGDKAR